MTNRLSDTELDEQRAAAVVSSQFPALAGTSVRRLGSGWDHDLYVLGDDESVVFRFPRRAERVPWLVRELEILGRVAPVLGSVVPRFDYLGTPSDLFPYPFVGYRYLRGVEADDSLLVREAMAKETGRLLAALHGIDPRGVPPTPVGWEGEHPVRSALSRLSSVAGLVGDRLPEAVRGFAVPYLRGDVHAPTPPNRQAHRLCHNDLCAQHVIVDPASGRIIGVLDWTDAMVTDPVVDFVGLITVGEYRFIAQVVSAYVSHGGEGVDGNFWERLIWLCRILVLTWLGEALQEDALDISRHIKWIERAFAQPDVITTSET